MKYTIANTKTAGFYESLAMNYLKNRSSAGLPMLGAGAGLLTKALMQERNIRKTDGKEDTPIYHLYNKLPITGFLAGTVGSKFWRQGVSDTAKILMKKGSLNSDVKLYPHQVDAVGFIRKNRHGIIAHATGLGKTLTSIAAFEKLKDDGKAKKALIIAPASLRDNYAKNIKEFTDSSYSYFGPKNEKTTKGIEDKSNSDYDIISYEMYKKDPDGIKERTGADTLIIDEVHRARNENSGTFKVLSDQAEKYNNVITLTGSLVNNVPSDIAPLIDITSGKKKNTIGNRKMFDSLFVRKDEKIRGIWNPKTVTDQRIINKPQLAKELKKHVHYRSHEDIDKGLPDKVEEKVYVPMSDEQKKLYLYSLERLDAITRLKIRNNIPVNQREMGGLFGKLIQGRKIMTDHAFMSPEKIMGNPYEYSPKVKKIVDDLSEHLSEDKKNKTVIYGNLINSQIGSVAKALDYKGIPYTTFLGVGNKDNSAKQRTQNVKDYMGGKKRVLLISGAGGEGLDLKGSSMMQMVEGHYNPEKIQQAIARVRRMGDERDEPIKIKKYISKIEPGKVMKFLSGLGLNTPTSIDEYIYNIAKRKDDLNEDFRSVLNEKRGDDNSSMYDVIGNTRDNAIGPIGETVGRSIGNNINAIMAKNEDLQLEKTIKQKLHNMGKSELSAKKHVAKITQISKIDERKEEVALANWMLGVGGAPVVAGSLMKYIPKLRKPLPNLLVNAIAAGGIAYGTHVIPQRLLARRALHSTDIPIAIEVYEEKLRKAVERKLKKSREYIDRVDRVDRLELDRKMIEV